MKIKPYTKRIILIIIVVLILALILYVLSYNYFINRKTSGNVKINATNCLNNVFFDRSNDRAYHIIYDESDELSVQLKNNIEDTINMIKVKYYVIDIKNIQYLNNNDIIILTVNNWRANIDAIDSIMDAVNDGASLIITNMPGGDNYFTALQKKFGITAVGDARVSKSLKVKDDIVLGLEPGDVLTCELVEDFVYDYNVNSDAHVYLTDEKDIPIYHTVKFGKGEMGVYNGENLKERNCKGLLLALIGTVGKDFVYPIINGSVFFIDDWPAPFIFMDKDIYEQYGMHFDQFLKYIWWPDMVALIEKYNLKFTGTLVLSYNNVQKPPFNTQPQVFSSDMYVNYQQIMSRGGEICVHGYNHQPLWFSKYDYEHEREGYSPWENEEYAKGALEYAVDSFNEAFSSYKMNCYVPPANIIDDTGIKIIKEVLGTPVVISSIYDGTLPYAPSFDFKVMDDVVYFPRFTSGSIFNDDVKSSMAFGMTSHGVISHFIHPDDVVSEERSAGKDWEQIRKVYGEMFSYIEERYPFIEYRTISECANRTIDWYNLQYDVIYADNRIKIMSANTVEDFSMIYKTDKTVLKGDGYEFEKLDDRTYCLNIMEQEVIVELEDKR